MRNISVVNSNIAVEGKGNKNFLGDVFPMEPHIFATPLGGVKYVVSITSDIDKPSYFDNVVALLSTATEYDEIVFNINSYGGYVDSLNMLIGWKAMCPAKQTHVLMGNASSAATALFLSPADNYIVGDYANFMCHEFQVGSGGTMSNSKRQTDHTYQQNEKFVKDNYQGFLNYDEIDDMLRGVEIYLDSKEIRQRLEAREKSKSESLQKKMLEEMDDLSEFTTEDLEEEVKALQAELRERKKKQKQPVDKTI